MVVPSLLCAKLFLAAVSANTHNPATKEQKLRLLATSKTKMQTLGAAVQKLFYIYFGVLKTLAKYPPRSSRSILSDSVER